MQNSKDIFKDDTYQYIYSVEEVNKKVKAGVPFRDAYREVASEIDRGRYRPGRDHAYTHLGSIGNPGLEEIEAKLQKAYDGFRFVNSTELVNKMRNYFEKS